MKKTDARIVVIGGGTGSFTLLQALKKYSPNITALVNMVDDGSSTGVLRDELGVLPPGDARQNLVALSESPKLRQLFTYRFSEGTLAGHTFGNIFLTALEKMTGNFAEGVEVAAEVLNIVGRVVPITLDNVHMVITWPDGTRVKGEGKVDQMNISSKRPSRPAIHLEPRAAINSEAAEAIATADVVVLSAGDIYTSLGPSLNVTGVREALQETPARIVYVCNLVTKPGHTDGMTVSDHAAEIERLAGAPIIDYVIYNTSKPPRDLFAKYVREGELLVEADVKRQDRAHYKTIGASLLASSGAQHIQGDPLAGKRSLIRHDGDAVVSLLFKILEGET